MSHNIAFPHALLVPWSAWLPWPAQPDSPVAEPIAPEIRRYQQLSAISFFLDTSWQIAGQSSHRGEKQGGQAL